MYFLEGNVGVGKTALISKLSQYLPELDIISEPVGAWNKSVFGQSLLANFYSNPKRWAYTLETLTLICRSQDHTREQVSTGPSKLLERSIYSGHFCFAKTGFQNSFLSEMEWEIYKKWADFLIQEKCIAPRGFVYLKAAPEICLERTQKRNRPSEKAISLKYLKQIDKAHDDFLLRKIGLSKKLANVPVLELDCSEDFLANPTKMADHARELKRFVRG